MSRLTIDFTNCLDDQVGAHGISRADLKAAAPRMKALTEQLAASRGTGWERWRELPFDPMRTEHVTAVKAQVDRLRDSTDHLIVLGIGGSALGNIALHAALRSPMWNLTPRDQRGGPRLFVLDNVDPDLVRPVLEEVRRADPTGERTVINVVSKSGETAETAAQFMLFRQLMRSTLGDAAADRIVAVTDPVQGTMRSICDDEGYATLPVPDGVGGRFSVLSPVGLFSAAMCGIDIDALLDGAAAMDARCASTDMSANPAATLAWLLMTLTERGKPNHVMMPYSNRLYLMADWFRQLWAESLGKQVSLDGEVVFAGATPIKALGATDQHSQVQLYREGPNDKVIGLIDLETFDEDITIPDDLKHERLAYLHGATLGSLLRAEKRATEYALVESERPNFTIRMTKLDAFAIGEFIQLWQVATAYAGLLLNIDTFNQPAVETGKQATFGLMGRDGYAEWRDKVEARLGGTDTV